MSKLDDTLQRALTSIPECVAAGFVDLASGMVLSIKTVDSHPSEVFDMLAAGMYLARRGMVALMLPVTDADCARFVAAVDRIGRG